MDDYLLHLAKAYSPFVGGPVDAAAPGVRDADIGGGAFRATAAVAAAAEICEGTRCVARAVGAIFASPTSWERIGRTTLGQELVAAGPPVPCDGFEMVPVLPTGAVDRAVLEVRSLRVERPYVAGSWMGWESAPMDWDEDAKRYVFRVRLERTEDFQLVCCGDWRRCLHPVVDGVDPRFDGDICGPDDQGHNKCWTVGDGSEPTAGRGSLYEISLTLSPTDGSAKRVTWASVSEGAPADGDYDGNLADAGDDGAFLALRPDRLARIHSLVRARCLNGEVCRCEHWDASVKRWRVQLRSGEVKLLKAENLEDADTSDYSWWNGEDEARLRRGADVCVRGLGGMLDFNGESGLCERWDDIKGRWLVRLRSGKIAAVRPENLQLVAVDAAPLREDAQEPAAEADDRDGDDDDPKGAFLRSLRPGARGRGRPPAPAAAEAEWHRPRLGVDVRPSRPRAGTGDILRRPQAPAAHGPRAAGMRWPPPVVWTASADDPAERSERGNEIWERGDDRREALSWRAAELQAAEAPAVAAPGATGASAAASRGHWDEARPGLVAYSAGSAATGSRTPPGAHSREASPPARTGAPAPQPRLAAGSQRCAGLPAKPSADAAPAVARPPAAPGAITGAASVASSAAPDLAVLLRQIDAADGEGGDPSGSHELTAAEISARHSQEIMARILQRR